MEQWLKDAKEQARIQAEIMVSDIRDMAYDLDVEKWWFFEEVIKHVHRIKEKEGEQNGI